MSCADGTLIAGRGDEMSAPAGQCQIGQAATPKTVGGIVERVLDEVCCYDFHQSGDVSLCNCVPIRVRKDESVPWWVSRFVQLAQRSCCPCPAVGVTAGPCGRC